MLTIVCAFTPYTALLSIHVEPAHSGSNSLLEQGCLQVTCCSCLQWKSVTSFQTCLACISFCFKDCSSKEVLCAVSPFQRFILVISIKEHLLEVRLSVSSGERVLLSFLTACQRYMFEELCLLLAAWPLISERLQLVQNSENFSKRKGK